MKTPRVAVVGASHWHVPLYVNGFKEFGIDICGVEDKEQTVADRLALDLNTLSYGNVDMLLDEAKPDFVFAFAKHHEMPALAKKLIDRKIDFAMEKPAGLNYQQVQDLANLAQANHVFCSIPFVWRWSEAVESIRSRFRKDDYVHMTFRFIVGPPQRYLQNGSPWMLDVNQAGGGCMTNVGVHFLDLALYLTESENLEVLSATHHYNSNFSIEDYAIVQLKNEKGVSITLEMGYAYPMSALLQRDNEWKIVTKNGYHTLIENNIEYRYMDKPAENCSVPTDTDVLYPIFVRDTLNAWIDGRQPLADLTQMARVRKILDQIYEKAAAK
jgi:predicted dehydrogenase